MAIFRSGRLVDTSLPEPDLLFGLDTPIGNGDLDNLNHALAPELHMRAAGTRLDGESVVVALVPVQDLDEASRERTLLIIGGTLGLLLTLVLMAMAQARAIARPLDRLVDVANALMRGDYGRRVSPTRNVELDQLGQAVNHLAGELERKVAMLTRQATQDPLSGLPNRLHFMECVEAALAQNAPDDAVALLFLDLDNFKIVNDSLGHSSGDRLIAAVADRLRGCLAHRVAEFTVARLAATSSPCLCRRRAPAVSLSI